MDNYIVVRANGSCLKKLMSYNNHFGIKVRIYLDGEFYCDIYINPKLLFKALYEASKKGAGVDFYNFDRKIMGNMYKHIGQEIEMKISTEKYEIFKWVNEALNELRHAQLEHEIIGSRRYAKDHDRTV